MMILVFVRKSSMVAISDQLTYQMEGNGGTRFVHFHGTNTPLWSTAGHRQTAVDRFSIYIMLLQATIPNFIKVYQ